MIGDCPNFASAADQNGTVPFSEIILSAAPRPSPLAPSPCRSAFTLVELLVVITILSIVTIAAIPLVVPALTSRAVREAARIVNTQLSAAQSQALANGRSAGLWIERLPADPTAAMDLYMAEVPPPYAGQDVNETVKVTISAPNSTTGTVTFSNPSFFPLLRPGDLIRFNYAGPYYELLEANGKQSTPDTSGDPESYVLNSSDLDKTFQALSTDPTLHCPPAAYGSGWTVPFQVFRQPAKTAGSPVQLPTGAIIDLIDSSVGNLPLYRMLPNNILNVDPSTASNQQIADDKLSLFTADPNDTTKPNTRAIVLVFDKTGAVSSIWFNMSNKNAHGSNGPQAALPVTIDSPVYLMIGKREKVFQQVSSKYDPSYYNTADNASTQSDKQNFRDLENQWVAVNPQSGLATTAEVADLPPSTSSSQTADQYAASLLTTPTQHDILANAINLSRQFAQSAQAEGGK